ncbi:hypothetical protein [Streptomyces sp. NPDC005953]|uniref:hypothetical protein n=1 Tax=Streptomyces sp. NPDC005953 TaxID=3156719 RepID=UPI0033F7255B
MSSPARHTADTITDDALDALYDDRARLAELTAGHVTFAEFAKQINTQINKRRTALTQRRDALRYANEQRARAEQAEAALERVRQLHHDYGPGDCVHCTHVDAVPWPCLTIQALNQPKDT